MEAMFKDIMKRCESVIKEKWPLSLDGGAFAFAMAHHPDLHKRFWSLDKEANELWLNNQPAQFKKTVTEWGRTVIEIHNVYRDDQRNLFLQLYYQYKLHLGGSCLTTLLCPHNKRLI